MKQQSKKDPKINWRKTFDGAKDETVWKTLIKDYTFQQLW